jgi:lysozyme family protein
MSTLELAMPTIFRHEGLFSMHPNDPGGATNFGISLRFLLKTGDLDNDGIPDGDVDGDGDIDIDDIKKMSPDKSTQLYDLYFWKPNNYGQINDQLIATKVFTLNINMVYRGANKCLQRAVRAASKINLSTDGVIGQKTLNAVNSADPKILLAALKSEAAGYYRAIKYAGSEDFLTGWLNRAYD